MATGSEGQKRLGDAVDCAVKVARNATGEITESQPPAR